jgi:response regulator NasT
MTGKTDWTALRVLIVAREGADRDELRTILEDAGREVVGCASRQSQGCELALRFHPDAVLLDVELAQGDGIDLAVQLSDAEIGPVLVVTSQFRPELARRAAEAGVFSYLVQPTTAPKLLASLDIAHGLWLDARDRARRLDVLRERLETRQLVDRAKKALMTNCGYTEPQAYRFMQTRSMNSRRSMRWVAEAVLTTHEIVGLPSAQPVEASGLQEVLR